MRRLVYLTCLLFSLWLVAPARAEVLVNEPFTYASEAALQVVWAKSCAGSTPLGISSAFSVSPTTSVKSVMNGGVNTCFMDRDFPQTNHVFYKWTAKFENFDWCTGPNGSKQMYAKGPGGAGFLVFWHIEGCHASFGGANVFTVHMPLNGFFRNCPASGGLNQGPQPNEECIYAPNQPNPTNFNANGQYVIEVEAQTGTPGLSDGIFRAWINGKLEFEYTGVPFFPATYTGPTKFGTITHYAQMGFGTRYIDDLFICSDSILGCGGTILMAEDFEVATIGDLVGASNVNLNGPAAALNAKGWLVTANCPGAFGYCPGAIVSITGHNGTLTKALRFRYQEGPASDSANTSLEVKITKECAFGAQYCFGSRREFWLTTWYMTQPVPANTPSCTPNCPTTSSYNNVATKQHYLRDLAHAGGVSFVTDHFFNSRSASVATQDMIESGGTGTADTISPPNGVGLMADNIWYCKETYIKYNDPGFDNGIIRQFLTPNGQTTIQTINNTTYSMTASSTMGIDNFFFYRQSGGYQWRFEDDFTFSTVRVGCGGTSGGDTSGPSVPTAFTVR